MANASAQFLEPMVQSMLDDINDEFRFPKLYNESFFYENKEKHEINSTFEYNIGQN